MKAYTLIGLAAIIIGCGSPGRNTNNEDSGCRDCSSQDAGFEDSYNSDSSHNNSDGSNLDAGTDSSMDVNNRDSSDSGLECCVDGGREAGTDVIDGGDVSDSGRENNAPSVQLVYEPGHPLTGEVYANRNIRRGRDTTYLANGSDPDGDVPLEFRFRFSDGFTRDWNINDRVRHIIGVNGSYTVDVDVRDSRGLEGDSYSVTLNAMDNIPPVADAGPDFTLNTFQSRCVVFGSCLPPNSCHDGPYAPGHSAAGTNNYDEDGSIPVENYEIFPNYMAEMESRYFAPCAGITYFDPGTYILRLRVTDNEGAQSTDDAIVTVVDM